MISVTGSFLSAVFEAVLVAQKGYLVTIGIAPSYHPRFGCVRLGFMLGMPEAPNGRLVSNSKEKPDARTAAAPRTSQLGKTAGTRACSSPRPRS